MKLGLVIASHGRPDILQQVLMNLVSQPRLPDVIVVSAVDPADIPQISASIVNVRTIFGDAGLTCQRNRGMSYLIDTTDVIVFIDDDFLVGDDYFLNLERIFERDR
ncbi:MAG: glycosyltransferase family 2 protein, partial [Beijerinckiaceae bacterium]